MTLSEEIRSLIDDQELSLEQHPTPDELTRFCSGALPSIDREAVLDHLSLCSTCVDLVSALMPLGTAPSRPQPVINDSDIESAWGDFEVRLAANAASPSELERRIHGTAIQPSRSRWRPLFLRLAAGLAIGVIGFALGGGYFSGDIFADPYLIDLTTGVQRSGQADLNYTKVPTSPKLLMLILTLREEVSFPSYRIGVWRAADPDGSPILIESAGFGGPRVTFSLGIPRSKLAAGQYVVKVFGIRDERSDPLEIGLAGWKLDYD